MLRLPPITILQRGAGTSRSAATLRRTCALNTDFEKEAVLFAAALEQAKAGNADVFDDPLNFELMNVARHAFWPAHQDLPTHLICAKMVLGGQLMSTENKRFHNVAGYVNSKLRANISDENLEHSSAAKVTLTKNLKVTSDGLDAVDAADELLQCPASSM